MTIFHWLLIAALVFCFVSCLRWFLKLIKQPKDYADPKGSVADGVTFSCTKAMLPTHKESAYLHLPTYIAGIIYHIGTFTSIILLLLQLIFTNFMLPYTGNCEMGDGTSCFIFSSNWTFVVYLRLFFAVALAVSSLCGVAILIKRFTNKELKALSNIDDYLSNIFVTLFQMFSAIVMVAPYSTWTQPALFIMGTILFIYMPLGKLRHVIYFLSARYQLGAFYGKRGVWSMKNKKHQSYARRFNRKKTESS